MAESQWSIHAGHIGQSCTCCPGRLMTEGVNRCDLVSNAAVVCTQRMACYIKSCSISYCARS